jgi:hypothetical protein
VLVLVGAEGSALADGDPQGLLLGGVLRAIDQREVVGGLVDGPGGEGSWRSLPWMRRCRLGGGERKLERACERNGK